MINRKKLSGLGSRLETIKKTVEIHMANIAKLTHAYLIKFMGIVINNKFPKGVVKLYSNTMSLCECCHHPSFIIYCIYKNANPAKGGTYADMYWLPSAKGRRKHSHIFYIAK